MNGEVPHTSSVYLAFVALGTDGGPTPVPALIAETDEEKKICRGSKQI
ncbi:MAG: hypothetical protein PHD01_09140 [Geobacteraceae bacterium]|nr:hypothetical protein [Geobacteraceae bacterium]